MQGQNTAIQNYLVPQYQNLIQNPGYDPKTKAAITNAGEGAAAASFGSASDAIDRGAARTNNSAGVAAGQDALAMEKGRTMADVASKDQIQFADAARSDVRAGEAGLSGLYGVDQQLLARSLGVPVEYLGQYNSAWQKPSFLQSMALQGVSSAGQVGAAALGPH
ncbi:MAG TPA: hypothetical protein VIH67_04870 [Candidatus Acidoferrum sp.]